MIRAFRSRFLFTLFSILLLGCENNAIESRLEPEIYLIPEGYAGVLYVIFENKGSGGRLTYENGARVYDFSESNVIVTSAKNTCCSGLRKNDIKFFYLRPDGTRIPLEQGEPWSIHDTPENRQDKAVKVFRHGSRGQSFIGNKHGEACEIDSTHIIVGTKDRLLDAWSTNDPAKSFSEAEKKVLMQDTKLFELQEYTEKHLETCQ